MSRRRESALAALALPIVLAGCMPTGVTEQSRAVTTLWAQFLVAAALVGGTVWVLITVMLLRYRRRSADPAVIQAPAAPTDSRPVELAWTAVPIVIVLILFGLTLVALGTVDARSPSRVTVDVTAFRWQWRFDYEGTPVRVVGDPDTVARMVVPVGEPIHIVLTSADVDHAFYVPQFLFKRDAIPGHPNEFDVTITDPGTYNGQCAEFCGIYHDRMLLSVQAVSRAEYDAWLAAQAAASAGPSAAAPSGSTPP
jgi:cytochrome c oxidase subunit 2